MRGESSSLRPLVAVKLALTYQVVVFLRRLVDEVEDFSAEYHDRARVVQLSDKAFGYDVAVKEYLKKVKKLLPGWLHQVQSRGSVADKPSSSPQKLEPRVVSGVAEEPTAAAAESPWQGSIPGALTPQNRVSSTITLSREGSLKERVWSPRADQVDAEEEEEEEEDQHESSSPGVSLSPAFVPVQTAKFTASITKPRTEDASGKKKTPEQASTRARPPESDPEAEGGREASDVSRTTTPRQPARRPTSEAAETPTRVRFLGEEVDLEDSQETFESYSYTEAAHTPVGRTRGDGNYTESEVSAESSRGRYSPSPQGAMAEGPTRATLGSAASSPNVRPQPQPSPWSTKGVTPEAKATAPSPALIEEEESSSSSSSSSSISDGAGKNSVDPEPTERFSPGPSRGADEQEDDGEEERRDPPAKSVEGAPKLSTIANRTFDTDTEESEVFYQSYQTRQLSKESSDEFDF